jgi:L-ribulose-5-phosphate 4-epimerase
MKHLDKLKQEVFRANIALHRSGLVFQTFGNVSGVDREAGVMAIKPSGVDYAHLRASHMVLVDLATGKTMASKLRPSSDTPSHLEIYRAFPCGGIVHTHSRHATALAQCRLAIRCTGTTQADYFHGDVPVTRPLTRREVVRNYEKNTGLLIVETFRRLDPASIPAALVANHGPFCWGKDPLEAVRHAKVLEFVAEMEIVARLLGGSKGKPAQYLISKHFLRKHGKGAYYGQAAEKPQA